ncbi:hypothetical protein RSSM_05701 [Rhodopirellula sallentina SM41]|uniref:Uncharacterized protein n=1 Tax=Rhodopirellula sallentina SM41 TaxID=1263870 RepID=M5TUL7_9BACT|nr:hypothetical protein RSSM_05701 [Rhodopirellula sallentina SM41]
MSEKEMLASDYPVPAIEVARLFVKAGHSGLVVVYSLKLFTH